MTTIRSRILVRRDTTEAWNRCKGFIPLKGEIIVYTDRYKQDGKDIPGIKIGDGNAYCIDLPYLSAGPYEEVLSRIQEHENNHSIHVSASDRNRWDNKINIDINSETIIFNKL